MTFSKDIVTDTTLVHISLSCIKLQQKSGVLQWEYEYRVRYSQYTTGLPRLFLLSFYVNNECS